MSRTARRARECNDLYVPYFALCECQQQQYCGADYFSLSPLLSLYCFTFCFYLLEFTLSSECRRHLLCSDILFVLCTLFDENEIRTSESWRLLLLLLTSSISNDFLPFGSILSQQQSKQQQQQHHQRPWWNSIAYRCSVQLGYEYHKPMSGGGFELIPFPPRRTFILPIRWRIGNIFERVADGGKQNYLLARLLAYHMAYLAMLSALLRECRIFRLINVYVYIANSAPSACGRQFCSKSVEITKKQKWYAIKDWCVLCVLFIHWDKHGMRKMRRNGIGQYMFNAVHRVYSKINTLPFVLEPFKY